MNNSISGDPGEGRTGLHRVGFFEGIATALDALQAFQDRFRASGAVEQSIAREVLTELRGVLVRHQSQDSVLVPIKPTEAMVRAAIKVDMSLEEIEPTVTAVEEMWADMLEASPAIPPRV